MHDTDPLDPAAIMAEHEGLAVDGDGSPAYCINLDHGDAAPFPCETRRLAAALAEANRKLAAVEILANVWALAAEQAAAQLEDATLVAMYRTQAACAEGVRSAFGGESLSRGDSAATEQQPS